MAVSGIDLYAGGLFSTAGGVSATRIAKWDGSTHTWSALGSGIDNTPNPTSVFALAVSGTDLYAGGDFYSAGGVIVNNIARWNGSEWSALGSGTDSSVRVLTFSGMNLYAGGGFSTAGGVSANAIAKWNGSSWSPVGSGFLNGSVYTLAVSGTDLYAGGVSLGGGSANYIDKWNGSEWSAMGSGTNSAVVAMAVSGTNLYVGGSFTTAGNKTSRYVARAMLVPSGPDIAVEQPAGTILTDGNSTVSFGGVLAGATASKTFIIRNTGNADLTGLGIAFDGTNGASFIVTSGPTAPVSPAGSTTFTVRFAPSTIGSKTAALHIASNVTGSAASFDINLGGTGLTQSENWRQQYFDSTANSGAGADLNDYDRDGLVNLIEFAAASNPTTANGPFGAVVRVGENLTFTYTRNKAAVSDGLTFAVEWSDTLAAASWNTAGVSETASDQGDTELVTATLPAAPNGHRFIHLRVTRP